LEENVLGALLGVTALPTDLDESPPRQTLQTDVALSFRQARMLQYELPLLPEQPIRDAAGCGQRHRGLSPTRDG